MLLPTLPCTNIRAAVDVLVLPLTLELVCSKLPLVHCTIRHPHDALPLALAASIATGITPTLSNQVQPNSLPFVIAVLPEVGVSVAVHCLGAIILPLISTVISA